jgi:hypothetical protein
MTIAGLPRVLGSGGDRYCWVWIVGWPELLSETGAEGAIIDGATNLKQQIGAASRPAHLHPRPVPRLQHRSLPASQSRSRVHSRSKNRRENTPFGAYTPKLAAVPHLRLRCAATMGSRRCDRELSLSKAWARTTVSYGVARSTTIWGIPAYLAIGVLIFLVIGFMNALTENLQLMRRWLERPYLVMFPAISAAAAVVLGVSVRRRRNEWPFYMVTLIFVSALGTLTISLRPCMIPFVLTIGQAAAPHASLSFMFWGAVLFIYLPSLQRQDRSNSRSLLVGRSTASG